MESADEYDYIPPSDSDSDYVEVKQKPKKQVKAADAAPKKPATSRPKKRKEEDRENLSDEDGSPKKKVAAPKKKAPAKKVLASSNDLNVLSEDDGVGVGRTASKSTSSKTVEEIYQKKTQLEHIILRPDTYIGSVEYNKVAMWVYDGANFVYKDINYVPGLYKIFDEILVNAADNKSRDKSMDTLKVTINRESGEISIYNNGKGIPIQIHKEEGVYVPELIFGHLLTSSNYDDSEKKVTGGRNGYGAKLCNIFSKKFVVETGDSETKQKYSQTFSENMSKKTEPKITSHKGEDFTKITFLPDFGKFGMTELDDDILSLFRKRVYDLAGCVPGIKVYLDDTRIKVRSFKDYVDLYIPEPSSPGEKKPSIVYEKVGERWEVAFIPSPDGQFHQVSFVNAICTSRGGTHVTHVSDQIVSTIVEAVKKKDKKGTSTIKPHVAKSQIAIFVNSLIENPSFDTQTKECMTLKVSSFGSKCTLGEDFMKKVQKSGVIDSVLAMAHAKSDQALKKTDGHKQSRISGISKLDDANHAGTKQGANCTLILTEGDSAKTLAVSGLSVVGRDTFGVFPLRGKLLNVREANSSQITNNAEITALKKILGLQQGKKYESAKDLRYGHIMIMTDQDHDGSHIKGLIINFLDHFWPSLLKIPGFLQEFITPIVKVTPIAKGGNKKEISFYTIPEYEEWKRENNDGKGYNIKYYKGLGTSTPDDAKKYFSNIAYHRKPFEACTNEDSALVDMAFSKKKVEDRKEWLRQFQPGTFMDHSVREIKITDFINKELILFSIADNQRSIPSSVDGMKPGQRKILYCCFKRNLKNEIKVTQLSGYISEHSAYHHGDQSLVSTIVGMAQNYVGSNNLNLLEPRGQFGTRLQGGKDHASARYIFTMLNQITRIVFHPEDDSLLKYLNDDGQDIEPQWYLPILPMILVNGSDGIGTGWSSSIPNYNPRDIVENLYRMMDNQQPIPMTPWYRGFAGSIEPSGDNKFKVSGTIRKTSDNTIEITELPIRVWTQSYKEQLESWMTGDDEKKIPASIQDFKEYHTDTSVHFIVTLSDAQMKAAEEEGLEKKFKISSSMSTTNLVCFDLEGRICKYATVEDIMKDFFKLRLQYYIKRKESMLNKLMAEYQKLDNKVRFIMEIIKGTLIVQNRKKADIVKELRNKDYLAIPKAIEKKGQSASNDEDDDDTEESAGVPGKANQTDFDYLLGMAIVTLTIEKVEQLKRESQGKKDEITVLTEKSPMDLWRTDLDAFLIHWENYEKIMADRDSAQPAGKKKLIPTAAPLKKPKKTATKKEKSEDDDDDSGDKKAVKKETDGEVKKASRKKKEETISKSTEDATSSVWDIEDDDVKSKPTGKTITSYFGSSEFASLSTFAPAAEGGETKKKILGPRKAVLNEKDAAKNAKLAALKPVSLDSDDDFVAPRKVAMDIDEPKPAKKAAPKKAKKVISSDEEDEDISFDDDEDDEDDVKPKSRSKPKAKATVKDAMDVDEPKVAKKQASKAKNVVVSDDEDDMQVEVINAPKKAAPAKKPKKVVSSDEEEEELPKSKSKATAKVVSKAASTDDDDESGRRRPARTTKAISYKTAAVILDSDDEEGADDQESDGDDDWNGSEDSD
ncbi:DNA topoisomerase 2 [Phlyctochytrium planicorne]|nr:DNA topoisomerase 2 [Phlyctochytrium planicorne]